MANSCICVVQPEIRPNACILILTARMPGCNVFLHLLYCAELASNLNMKG
jgi:hypothetical protein